jgi:hypothetical protein
MYVIVKMFVKVILKFLEKFLTLTIEFLKLAEFLPVS